jgi:Nif-specific regulatory protein
MSPLTIEVLSGESAGRMLRSDASQIRIGRGSECDVALPGDSHVSPQHARLTLAANGVFLEDLQSATGTRLNRSGSRAEVSPGTRVAVYAGDLIELGTGEQTTTLRLDFDEADGTHVVELRSIPELSDLTRSIEGDDAFVRALYDAQRTIGDCTELDDVLERVAASSLTLTPRATHVTIVLQDDDGAAMSYVPVLTRSRSGDARETTPIPIARSVYRRVIRDRAAILAADAPSDFSSESLLGASIRSTIGVPLWRGEELLGVVQVDNRDAPGMFGSRDVDVLGVLAANASLAIANARLIRRLRAAEEQLRRENAFLKTRERARTAEAEIIGQSRSMADLMKQIDKVANTRATVLIEGETGVGKELVASALHYRSKRRDKLLVTQNCAALPENLLESELFGHKRGAFTGATEDKKGLFEVADGGTLFLDEVTEMPSTLQAKLLRVLQQGELRPLGSTSSKSIDVRIVAASNRDLEQEVAQGRFREDLYYRLKVFPLRVPPLRERREDIALLCKFFLGRYSKEIGKPVAGFSQQALELMAAYDWPGNVRELQNEVQRVVIQAESDGFAAPELLSPRIRKSDVIASRVNAPKGTLKEMMDQVERQLLLEALREHGNNKTSAAKALGITREGLHKKLRQLGIG